jgi:nucleoside-diphosphate-sugar epimerase
MRTAIFGASGFVGATLVEQFEACGIDEVVPFIHSAGSAWRLSRKGMKLHAVDITDYRALRESLRGIRHVVNCTRGSDQVMLKGLKNLLKASREEGVERFVHLSSVAVYGDPPPPESSDEGAVPRPAPKSYGSMKLEQDRMVESAHRGGLPCVVLCPPNISGAYSSFVCNVLAAMRDGSLGLLEGGETVCNVVDVENLCHAIRLALSCDRPDGRRIFITDGERITWKRLTDELMELAEREPPLPELTWDQVRRLAQGSAPGGLSLLGAAKHLVSSDVREVLRKNPLLCKIDVINRNLVALMPEKIEDWIRYTIEGPTRITKTPPPDPLTSRYNPQQMRRVEHSCKRATKVLGYNPKHSFAESMRIFRNWFREMTGFGTPSWALVRELERI